MKTQALDNIINIAHWMVDDNRGHTSINLLSMASNQVSNKHTYYNENTYINCRNVPFINFIRGFVSNGYKYCTLLLLWYDKVDK